MRSTSLQFKEGIWAPQVGGGGSGQCCHGNIIPASARWSAGHPALHQPAEGQDPHLEEGKGVCQIPPRAVSPPSLHPPNTYTHTHMHGLTSLTVDWQEVYDTQDCSWKENAECSWADRSQQRSVSSSTNLVWHAIKNKPKKTAADIVFNVWIFCEALQCVTKKSRFIALKLHLKVSYDQSVFPFSK